MLVLNKNLHGNKEHVISYIASSFVEGVAIIYRLESTKIYVSDTDELYKDTIVGMMGNSGTADLSLHLVCN